MIIPAYFHDAGVPKTGLSPTIDIYRVSDNSLVVNDGAMTEVGGGFYKYDFAAYSSAQDYLYVCDGTATLSNAYRYVIGATDVDGSVADILVDTAVIGVAGAGLTAVPWNAAWDAEVQSEVQDAIEANNLDHLMKTAVANEADMTAEVADDTVLSLLMTQLGDTSTYFPGGCSLLGLYASFVGQISAVYDTVITNAAGDDIAADIIALKAETVAILEDTGTTLPAAIDALPTAVEIQAEMEENGASLLDTIRDTLGVAGAGLTAVPWNAAWDAEVESEVTDALNAYDPPTKAELDAADDAVLAAVVTLQATVDSIGSGTGAALNFAATDDNVDGDIVGAPTFDPVVPFVGVQTSGTYASTAGEDGTKHQIDDTANEIDIIYQFNIGSGRNAAKVIFKGYLSGVGDTCQVKAYNFVTATWDTRATITGQTGSTNITKDIALLANHTGTGAYAGLVYVRFDSTASNQTLYVDELLVAGVAVGLTVGYIDGLVWVDANSGTAGTTPFIHGTADNPCTTLADALVIAAAVGITGLNIAPGTTLTLTANSNKYRFVGGGRLELGGQSIEEATFLGLYTISGLSTGDDCFFEDCGIGDATLYHAYFLRCRMKGTLTFAAAQEYFFHQCFDANESSDVQTFVFAAGAKMMQRDWSGGMQINNMAAGDEAIIDGTGRVVIDGSCTGGSITLRGHFPVPTGASAFIAAGGTITQTQRFGTDQIMADTAGTTSLLVSVADIPTNAELTTALAAADDAVLAAIAALNNLSSAGAQAAAAAALAAYGAALQTSVDDLESRLTAARAGYLDNLSAGAVATAAAVAALPTTAQINAEVVDALNVDTYAEPGQGTPAATLSLAQKIGYLFKSWRNEKRQSSSSWDLYNDAGAVVDQKATVSEAGAVVTKGKIGTGP